MIWANVPILGCAPGGCKLWILAILVPAELMPPAELLATQAQEPRRPQDGGEWRRCLRRRSPPGSCSFTRAVSASNISVNPLLTISDDEFVEFIVNEMSIRNFLIALREPTLILREGLTRKNCCSFGFCIFDHFGPIWTLSDHFRQNLIFCSKSLRPRSTFLF